MRVAGSATEAGPAELAACRALPAQQFLNVVYTGKRVRLLFQLLLDFDYFNPFLLF